MIRVIDDLPAGAVGFSAIGVVTQEDYEDTIMPAVAAVIAMGEGLRLLYHFGPGFERFDSGALWEDAILGYRHAFEWNRIAVVSDIEWIGFAVRAMHWMLPGKVRLYPDAEMSDARAWLSEPHKDD